MDIDAAKTTLNLRLGDTDNFSFTDDEKTQALTEAFNDEGAITPKWDSSLTFDSNTYQYARPIDVVHNIYIRPTGATDSEPTPVSADLWEVVRDNIQFKNGANRYIPDGYTLYLRGANKYTTSDTVVETNVQEYILNLAQLHCLNMFGVKKAIKFVNNDSSMSEIVGMKRELERKVSQYRARLPRAYEVA